MKTWKAARLSPGQPGGSWEPTLPPSTHPPGDWNPASPPAPGTQHPLQGRPSPVQDGCNGQALAQGWGQGCARGPRGACVHPQRSPDIAKRGAGFSACSWVTQLWGARSPQGGKKLERCQWGLAGSGEPWQGWGCNVFPAWGEGAADPGVREFEFPCTADRALCFEGLL